MWCIPTALYYGIHQDHNYSDGIAGKWLNLTKSIFCSKLVNILSSSDSLVILNGKWGRWLKRMIVYGRWMNRNILNLKFFTKGLVKSFVYRELWSEDSWCFSVGGQWCCCELSYLFLSVSKLRLPCGMPIIDLVRTSKYDSFLPTLVITDIFQNISHLFFSIRNMLLFIFQSDLYNAITIKHAKHANWTHLDLLNERGT